MDKRIMFFDIDGTLVDNHQSMSDKVVEGLRLAKENGHLIFICSGRNMAGVQGEMSLVDFDGVVASAGGHIEVEGQTIYNDYINEELLRKTRKIFDDLNIIYNLEGTTRTFMPEKMMEMFAKSAGEVSNSELERLKALQIDKYNVSPMEEYDYKIGIHKVCFMLETKEQFESAKEQLSPYYNFVIHQNFSSNGLINGEIILKSLSKGHAIVKVIEYLNRSITDTVGFGDSMNDYEMIRTVHLGVAMSNGVDELKDVADVVCRSVEEDGVYYALKELKFI